MPAFSETRWRPWGSGCRLQTLSVLTLPLEVSAVRLLSNCSCRLTAPGAGFLGCFRSRKMGQSAAASSLAPRWPSQLPGWEPPPTPRNQRLCSGRWNIRPYCWVFLGSCRGLRGQRVPNWLRLPHPVPLSPNPAGAVPTYHATRGWGRLGGPQPGAP